MSNHLSRTDYITGGLTVCAFFVGCFLGIGGFGPSYPVTGYGVGPGLKYNDGVALFYAASGIIGGIIGSASVLAIAYA